MPNTPGGEAADTAGRALLADMIRDGASNKQIADTLGLSRARLDPKIAAVRADLAEAGAQVPPPLGPWGHRRG